MVANHSPLNEPSELALLLLLQSRSIKSLNIPTIYHYLDYTRFSRNLKAPIPAQIAGHAILPVIITTFGIVATSAAVKVFPNETKLLWAPYEVLLAFQQLENAGPGTRAATFFGGLAMVVPQLGINVFW